MTYDQSRGRFHDGKPITVDDVIFSFTTLKTQSPFYAQYYRNVESVEKTGDPGSDLQIRRERQPRAAADRQRVPDPPEALVAGHRARRTPAGRGADRARDPARVGGLPAEKLRGGADRRLRAVPDYWARDLNVNRGKNNIGEIRNDYYRDTAVLLEAFKGDQYDYRTENVARNWATAYDIPAVREGRIVKEEFPERSSGVMQGFVFNLRRDKFKDERVRRAFHLAFDSRISIERSSGLYKRIDSYFFGTELASSGLPQGEELAVLEPLRDRVPPAVFDSLQEPRQRHDRSREGEPARSRPPHAGGRIRVARSANGQQYRRALHGRVPDVRFRIRALRPALQAGSSSGSGSE